MLNETFKKIKREIRFFLRDIFINGIAASNFMPVFIRIIFYKIYGIDIKSKIVRSGCFFGGPRISIGSGTFINYRCFFEGTNKIHIGENCALGMNVTFCNSNHDYSNPYKRAGAVNSKSIIVKDGVWIGANSIILPGVTIEKGCVISAGSVVTNNCNESGIYGGVPARRIKDL